MLIQVDGVLCSYLLIHETKQNCKTRTIKRQRINIYISAFSVQILQLKYSDYYLPTLGSEQKKKIINTQKSECLCMCETENVCVFQLKALEQWTELGEDYKVYRCAYWSHVGNKSKQVHMAPTAWVHFWETSAWFPTLFNIPNRSLYCVWSTVFVIAFIHPHMLSKQSSVLVMCWGNNQMLCTIAVVFMTKVWLAEHLFSHLTSVFLSLYGSFHLFALTVLPKTSFCYSPPAIFLQCFLKNLCMFCFVLFWSLSRFKPVLCTKTEKHVLLWENDVTKVIEMSYITHCLNNSLLCNVIRSKISFSIFFFTAMCRNLDVKYHPVRGYAWESSLTCVIRQLPWLWGPGRELRQAAEVWEEYLTSPHLCRSLVQGYSQVQVGRARINRVRRIFILTLACTLFRPEAITATLCRQLESSKNVGQGLQHLLPSHNLWQEWTCDKQQCCLNDF